MDQDIMPGSWLLNGGAIKMLLGISGGTGDVSILR